MNKFIFCNKKLAKNIAINLPRHQAVLSSVVGDSRNLIIDQIDHSSNFRFCSFQIRGSCEPQVYYQIQLNLVQSVTTYLEKFTMSLADDWGKSFRDTLESFF